MLILSFCGSIPVGNAVGLSTRDILGSLTPGSSSRDLLRGKGSDYYDLRTILIRIKNFV